MKFKIVKMLGWNMQQVDRYLERLRRAQDVEMTETDERVSRLRHEYEILLVKRQSLEEEQAVRTGSLTALQKAYEQIDAARQAAAEAADREIAELWSSTRRRLLAYETTEADIDQRAERLRGWSQRALSGLTVTSVDGGSGSREVTARAMVATPTAVEMETDRPVDRLVSSEATIDARPVHSEHDTELTAFWGDASVLLAPESGEGTPTSEKPMKPVSITSMECDALSTPAIQPRPDAQPAPTPTPSPEPTLRTVQTAASPAISQQVRAVRQRYVIGKVAGQDLYNNQGGLIIARNHVITADVIDTAEKEGKLPELIVHMQLPGMGE